MMINNSFFSRYLPSNFTFAKVPSLPDFDQMMDGNEVFEAMFEVRFPQNTRLKSGCYFLILCKEEIYIRMSNHKQSQWINEIA